MSRFSIGQLPDAVGTSGAVAEVPQTHIYIYIYRERERERDTCQRQHGNVHVDDIQPPTKRGQIKPWQGGTNASYYTTKNLYTTTNKCLQCLLKIMYTVFWTIGVYVWILAVAMPFWPGWGKQVRPIRDLRSTANIHTYTPIVQNTVYIILSRHCNHLLVVVYKLLSRIRIWDFGALTRADSWVSQEILMSPIQGPPHYKLTCP